MKFKHVLKAHVAAEATSRIDFPGIDGCPWLEVRAAGESNRAYTAAVMRQPDKQRLMRGRWTPDEIAKERASAAPLYAEHILTGNGGGWVSEESGEEVKMPLSVDDRIGLLRQLPSDLFDRVRLHCNDLGNFRN
jgi:hypothetical protein